MYSKITCLLAAASLSSCSNAAPERRIPTKAPAAAMRAARDAAAPEASSTLGEPAQVLVIDASGSSRAPAEAGAGCIETASAEATLEPVHLAFAFDVSGSMGKLDLPYHDPKLKWEPVVAAAKGFFTDKASLGIFASLVFFPIDSGESKRCASDSYLEPDVPFTALPSDAFGDAIDAVTPKSSSDWRGGTPTLAVFEATSATLAPLAKADPSGKYAIVFVTDGYPEGCSSDDDKIATVVSAVAKVSAETKTYVIGVANPPGGPDTVTNLNDIAAAGGTKNAFIIQTGDPAQTVTDFEAAVRTIRTTQLSCDFEIPEPPPGQSFDPAKANVTYASGKTVDELGYDAACSVDGAWKFDDADKPSRMVLCDSTCAKVRADPAASLRVDFGCARRDVIR